MEPIITSVSLPVVSTRSNECVSDAHCLLSQTERTCCWTYSQVLALTEFASFGNKRTSGGNAWPSK